MGIGAIFGGLAGLLMPGGNALFTSLATGLGSLLIDKASPKDAIKNALFAGAGAKLFGAGIANSAMGKTATSGLASLGIGSAEQIAKITAAKAAAVAGAGATASAISPMTAYAGLSALALADRGDKGGSKPFYLSYHTGRKFDTIEEASAEDRRHEEKMGFSYPMGQLPQPTTPFASGGYIEGPGTGTSDSVPAEIRQGGVPVQKALLSDGEFVMTESAVTGAGNGDRDKGAAKMYAMMRDFERGQA